MTTAPKFAPRISMITLGVADLPRALAFYRDGLGFAQHAFESDSVAFFDLNGTWLGLYGWAALAEDAGVPVREPGYSGVALAHNVASPAEVETMLAIADQAGARIVTPARKVFWGGYSGYFADPDGHLWEVAHNPFQWIGPPDAPSDNI